MSATLDAIPSMIDRIELASHSGSRQALPTTQSALTSAGFSEKILRLQVPS